MKAERFFIIGFMLLAGCGQAPSPKEVPPGGDGAASSAASTAPTLTIAPLPAARLVADGRGIAQLTARVVGLGDHDIREVVCTASIERAGFEHAVTFRGPPL